MCPEERDLMLPAGALGDRFGRKRLLLARLAAFGIASVVATYAGGGRSGGDASRRGELPGQGGRDRRRRRSRPRGLVPPPAVLLSSWWSRLGARRAAMVFVPAPTESRAGGRSRRDAGAGDDGCGEKAGLRRNLPRRSP
ncbi:hypothetical protein GCM10010116_55590 [Microbispora rosea subsp. aerata]|nr:hypothetical protein GCM10010116_55590 [Microbispora rosea subsp. aerata]GIH56942.1 hypothetical protein Mro02_38560 [Microbispora rosea subsp. aerata]GLJ82868.1 hypothetical protein GCM10017588_15940 [Microbispora rosea subsp. aerata]